MAYRFKLTEISSFIKKAYANDKREDRPGTSRSYLGNIVDKLNIDNDFNSGAVAVDEVGLIALILFISRNKELTDEEKEALVTDPIEMQRKIKQLEKENQELRESLDSSNYASLNAEIADIERVLSILCDFIDNNFIFVDNRAIRIERELASLHSKNDATLYNEVFKIVNELFMLGSEELDTKVNIYINRHKNTVKRLKDKEKTGDLKKLITNLKMLKEQYM